MKKKEEINYLEQFKDHFSAFPKGTIKPCERPDFIIENQDKTIGIELTKVYQTNHSSLTFPAQDSIANDILERIKNLLKRKNHNAYEVNLIVSVDRNLTIKERDTIAKKVFRLIEYKIITSNVPCEILNDYEDLKKFPEEVSRISIYRIPNQQSPRVIDSKFSWIQNDMEDILQETINRKSNKVHQYHNCDELWLLIYSVSWSSGSFFNPSEETLYHKYSANFDRVFFYNSFDKKVDELKLN